VQELLPILSGLCAGLLLGLLRPAMRLPAGAGLAVLLGTLATVVTGEYKIGWEFLLIDIPLVAIASVISLIGLRVLRGAGGRPR
jgi:hypothetical protein